MMKAFVEMVGHTDLSLQRYPIGFRPRSACLWSEHFSMFDGSTAVANRIAELKVLEK